MTTLERLRLVTALASRAPGSHVRMTCFSGDVITAAECPPADLDIGGLRGVVLASACPERPDYTSLVDDIELSGVLQDLGAGLFRHVVSNVEQRWLATLLSPDDVRVVLIESDLWDIDGSGIRVRAFGDAELGVTVVQVSSVEGNAGCRLDAFGAAVCAACFVGELERQSDVGDRMEQRRNQ